jgi:tRNA threonylcarbamoyladenosine biosynthesis protein TsaB
MMSAGSFDLFIDSTYELTLGLLDEGHRWQSFAQFPNQKASQLLQREVFNMCEAKGFKVKDLRSVVWLAGPGFYTGLRLSEGFVDVLKYFSIPSFSFYSHEIPAFCGVNNATWITRAYRGEYFVHRDEATTLYATKDLPDFEEVYIHTESAIDDVIRAHSKRRISTLDLLKGDPRPIFSNVISRKLNRESYYFRAPEDEFRTSV